LTLGKLKPLPDLSDVPVEQLCEACTKRRDKKPKKKPQPRTVCKKGTYIQRAKGIVYSPKEEVPCQ